MRILFLTPQVPYPPRQGAALRNWGLISGLALRHEITVLSFYEPGPFPPPAELPGVRHLETVALPTRPFRERLRGLLLTRQPDMALRLASEQYADRLRKLLEQQRFDVAHIGGLEMAPYLSVLTAARPRPLLVFDNLNCEYLLQRRACVTDLRTPARWPQALYSFIQWQRLRRYEAQVCRRADRVIAVSEQDAEQLRRLVPGLQVAVVPNGVDTRAYTPAAAPADPATLVFTGTMDFRPNVDAVLWFVRKVLPRLRAEVQEVQLLVVGQRPHRRLEKLRHNPAVVLTGWVEDTRPYIARATVYVAPLRIGGGTRLKLLEAMAMGKPVVATTLGAEGYPFTPGRELLLADTPADFASAVLRLLRSPALGLELGPAAREFVEQHYDWQSIVPLAERVYTT
ncbi:MAG: glycosyltransferase [Anaerolineae bacterium]|nr:glycosyltransferase [Anaerolineae bacterium]